VVEKRLGTMSSDRSAETSSTLSIPIDDKNSSISSKSPQKEHSQDASVTSSNMQSSSVPLRTGTSLNSSPLSSTQIGNASAKTSNVNRRPRSPAPYMMTIRQSDSSSSNSSSKATTNPGSPLLSAATTNEIIQNACNNNSRIRRLSGSSQPRLRPEVSTDSSLLHIPNLQQQQQQQHQQADKQGYDHEESRNDYDFGNNYTSITTGRGRGGDFDPLTQPQPCFKQDPSLHHLPLHPVSLKPVERPIPSNENPPGVQGTKILDTGDPSPQHDNAAWSSVHANGERRNNTEGKDLMTNKSTLSSHGNTFPMRIVENQQQRNKQRPISPGSLAQKAEKIIEEARLQSSRSDFTTRRTEEILRMARLASSRTLDSSDRSLGSWNDSSRSLPFLSELHLDEERRREIIQEALRSRAAPPKEAHYKTDPVSIISSCKDESVAEDVHPLSKNGASSVSSNEALPVQSPFQTSLAATILDLPRTGSPQPAISPSLSPAMKTSPAGEATMEQIAVPAPEFTSHTLPIGMTPIAAALVSRVQIEGLNADKDDSDDSGQYLHRTRSAEEVLELANLLLDEVQAEVNRFPRVPIPMSPSYSSIHTGGSQNHHPQILGSTNVLSPATPCRGLEDGQEFDITSPTTSDVASIEDFETAFRKLPSRLTNPIPDGELTPCDAILRKLDGMKASPVVTRNPSMKGSQSDLSTNFEEESICGQSQNDRNEKTHRHDQEEASFSFGTRKFTADGTRRVPVVIKSQEVKQQPTEVNPIESWLTYFLGTTSKDVGSVDQGSDDNAFPVPCGSPQLAFYDDFPTLASSLIRVANEPPAPSFAEVVASNQKKANARLQDWVENKFMIRESLPINGTYLLGQSKTIIVHEILRGNWTWCTAWSPDGNRLAIATENHHLAVVDTTSSSVWRVRHDRRVVGPPKHRTTHSIRSIAWGENFIAIGGTGNAVSILATTEPYPILHTVTPTGFVGSMHWLPGTDKLLIGSRLGKAILLDIWAVDEISAMASTQVVREIQSTVLYIVDREKAWVNAVQFSPGGTAFAVGDSKGILGVYSFQCGSEKTVDITNIANFKLEDSILDIEWSSDGHYLYAGGEDFAITVISTQHWEPVHRIKRDTWVQFISSSHGASHIAVGGITSEASILDVSNGWDNVINVSLKGLVPLSAQWHPQDQYLVMTGQNNSILAIETTNARHVSGHFLRSMYAILSIAFSPDGRMTAIGNEMGVVTIFRLSSTTFVSVYEMVVDCSGSLSMEWSQNGAYLVIAAGDKVVIVARTETLPGSAPPNVSGFFVAKVIRDLGSVYDVSIDRTSRFVAASGTKTRVLDATAGFKNVLEMENGGTTLANSWSPDGKWFAAIGKDHSLVIYDTSPLDLSLWQAIFTVKTNQAGLALAWGRCSTFGLQYCAYGGEDKQINIMEIRTKERTWETVLTIPREGAVNDLDWNEDGLVAAAIGNGTVTILDLSYLQSGWAVNEMDYNWQRQALTCFTEIRRNRGKQSMKSVRWIPSAPGSDNLLAVGGTDGELEIIDLTERSRCRGFKKVLASV
jgi:WD40 repeat protein